MFYELLLEQKLPYIFTCIDESTTTQGSVTLVNFYKSSAFVFVPFTARGATFVRLTYTVKIYFIVFLVCLSKGSSWH